MLAYITVGVCVVYRVSSQIELISVIYNTYWT